MARRLVGAVVLLLVLAGCGGDPKSDPSPTPSPSTSPVATTPSAPAMPDAAKENTKAGAIAFVRYYVDLMNDLQHTGDDRPLQENSLPTCKSCESVAKAAKAIYDVGGHVEGGEWSITSIKAVRPAATLWQVTIEGQLAPSKVVNGPTSVPTAGTGGQANAQFFVRFDGGWKVAQWHTG